MFGHKQSLVEYDKEILENLDIAFSGLYLRHWKNNAKRDKSRHFATNKDKSRQIRTLHFCDALYLQHINQRQTIYE